MTGGQVLVFWCVIAGLVVVVLAEIWRWRHGSALQRSTDARLRAELQRHDFDV